MIGHPKHVKKCLELGADIICAQGGEGGGHTGAIPTSLLLPAVVDVVSGKVPVLGAGGFKDGRGLVAALAFGAEGIAMGTRFLLTQESPVPAETKKRYLACKNPGDIIVSKALDGLPQRMITNEFLAGIEKAGVVGQLVLAVKTGLDYMKLSGASPLQLFKSAGEMVKNDGLTWSQAIFSANAPMIIQKAMVDGRPAEGVLPSGQVAGVIDELPTCAELIERIVKEAEERLAALAKYSN